MLAALASAAVLVGLLVVALLAVGGLTVVPAVLALGRAERRGAAQGRCAAAVTAGAAVALVGCALVVLDLLGAGRPGLGLAGVGGLVLACAGWASAAGLLLAGRSAPQLLGVRGRHEQ